MTGLFEMVTEEEVDNDEDYEEANDEQLGEEEEDASAAAVGGTGEGTLPRIIAQESVDNDFDLAMQKESNTSPAVEEEVEQVASIPFSDEEEKSAITDATETREPELSSLVAEGETAAKESDEVLIEADSSNVEDMSVGVTSSPEEVAVVEEKQEEEEEVVPQPAEAEQSQAEETALVQAVTLAAKPKFDVTGVKEEVASEVIPLATAGVGNVLEESEVKETEQATIPPEVDVESKGPSSSLLEELRKLSESRSLREEPSEEMKPAVVTESAPEELSQTTAEKAEDSTVTESQYVVKRAASNDLVAELKKLTDARLESEASDKAASVSTVGEPPVDKEEYTSASEVVVDQKLVEVSEGSTVESLDELKELTYQFHIQGSPESDAAEVQSALATASDSAEKESIDSTSGATAVAEKLSPEVSEVRIVEEGKVEEADSAVAKEDLSKDVVEDSGVVPSPANLYTALKAVDDELPALKSENGNVAETEDVQSKSRGFSAVDFTGEDGDSDADAEDEDEENDDDDDEDEDETDMDTAKALAELANAVGKSGNPLFGHCLSPVALVHYTE